MEGTERDGDILKAPFPENCLWLVRQLPGIQSSPSQSSLSMNNLFSGVFVKNNQQQLLNIELPEAVIPVGENRNWLKILKGKLGEWDVQTSGLENFEIFPGSRRPLTHAQKRPEVGRCLTLTDLEALCKQEAKAEAGLSVLTTELISKSTQQGTQTLQKEFRKDTKQAAETMTNTADEGQSDPELLRYII